MENTTEKIRTTSFPARSGRVVLARIQRDTDLLTGIIDICRKNNFRMAVVETVIGSLRSAEITWAKPNPGTKHGLERTPRIPVPGPIEFISGQGIFCLADPQHPAVHFHGCFCDSEGRCWAGHFFPGGNPVHSTMDVVIQELLDVKMNRVYDEEIDSVLPIPDKDY